MKQTAVEWLYSRMFEKNGRITKEEYEQAKEMEKQQILDAHMEGHYVISYPVSPELEAEKYYNETFNTNEK
jgi:hypothetical protein